MILNELKIKNSKGSTLSIPVDHSDTPFEVKDIKGLGPVKTTLVSSSSVGQDGAQYNSSRKEPRNLLLSLGLNPDYSAQSVQSLRSQLYEYLMTDTFVTITLTLFDRFATSVLEQTLVVEIYGIVESHDPNLFTKDPTVDISIMCYKPDFVDPELVTFNGMTSFDQVEVPLVYKGTAKTGVLFTLLADRPVAGIEIFHRLPDNNLRISYYNALINGGELLKINSVPGDKYVTLVDGFGVESSRLYNMTTMSAWIELAPGDNTIRVYTDEAPVPYKIEYTNKYGGL